MSAVSALELIAKAIKLNRNDLLSRRARADIFTQQAKIDYAIAEYEGILQVSPNDIYAVQTLQNLRR